MSSFRYDVVEGWFDRARTTGRCTDAADVSIGPDSLVYVLLRHPGRIVVLTADGTVTSEFGQGVLSDRPHGVHAAPNGTIYCVDEPQHAIARFTPRGDFQGWIGTVGTPSDSGIDPTLTDPIERMRSMSRAAEPFNRPTGVALATNGDMYVTDGYGNAAVHRMTKAGDLLHTWGGPGEQPGEFRTPHYAVPVGDGRLVVCDRENGRLQVFDVDGTHLATWPAQRPSAVAYDDKRGLVIVAEMGVSAGEYLWSRGTVNLTEPAKIIILDRDGTQVGEITSRTADPADDGSFILPHGIAVDSIGDIYVAETTSTYRAAREAYTKDSEPPTRFGARIDLGPAPPTFHSLQKFARSE